MIQQYTDESFLEEENSIKAASVDQATQISRVLVRSLLFIARILYEQLRVLRKDRA